MTTPAPRLPIPFGHQLTLKMSQHGQECAIVLGASVSASAAAGTAWRQDWVNGAWASFRPVMLGSVSCTSAIVRSVSDQAEVWEGSVTSGQTNGGQVGTSSLLAACTVLKWRSLDASRSGKGRTFLPAVATSQVAGDGRTLEAAQVSLGNAAVAAYLALPLWAQDGIEPAVLSFTKGQASPIISGSCAGVVGLQRRRMR